MSRMKTSNYKSSVSTHQQHERISTYSNAYYQRFSTSLNITLNTTVLYVLDERVKL